jgi:glycine betaine transporter
VQRFGKAKYIIGNIVLMSGLTLLFKLDFLQIQWVGALAIGLILGCFGYIVTKKYSTVAAIECSPKENEIDFGKIELVT